MAYIFTVFMFISFLISVSYMQSLSYTVLLKYWWLLACCCLYLLISVQYIAIDFAKGD